METNKHFQYAVSSLSAKELAKEFGVEDELLPPLKFSEPTKYISLNPRLILVKQHVGKRKDKRHVYGSNYHRYFLLAKDEDEARLVVDKSCSKNEDFCFRDMNFKFEG